jgi:iron complex outermembrane receptor protein
VKGVEVNAEMRMGKSWRLNALYSKTDGKTAAVAGGPLDVEQGARAQGPDKLVAGVAYSPSDKVNVRLQASKYFRRDINIGRRVGTTILEEHFAGYTLADFTATASTRWGDFGIGIDNLFDKQYISYLSQSDAATRNDTYFAGRGRMFSFRYQRSF